MVVVGTLAMGLSAGPTPVLGAQQPDSIAHSDSTPATLAPIQIVGSVLGATTASVGSGVPARVTTVSRAQLRANAPRTIPEALAAHAGLSTYDDVGSPYELTLNMRGFVASPVVGAAQGVSVFLDGIRMNEPDAAQVNWDLLPMDAVERVEVLSGTASLLGRNSLGGAINLVSQPGEGAPTVELRTGAGSFGQREAGISTGGSRAAWHWSTTGSYSGETGWRQVTHATLANVLASVSRLGARSGVRVELLAARASTGTAGSLPESVYALRPDSNLTANDRDDLAQVQLATTAYAQLGTGRASLSAYARRHTAHRYNVNQADDPNALGRAENLTTGITADYRWATAIGRAQLGIRAGADASANRTRLRLFTDSTKLGGPVTETTDARSPNWDAGAFGIADVVVGRVTVSGGLRADYVRIPFRDQLARTHDATNSYARLSPRAGVRVDAGRGLSLYASVGQSFRAPAVIELACADPDQACPLPYALGDDPRIAPVVATTLETGGAWAHGPFVLSASAYQTGVMDDIYLFPYRGDSPDGSTIAGYFGNLPRTRRAGVEASATTTAAAGTVYVTWTANRATFQSTADIVSVRGDSNVAHPGDRIPLVPDQQLSGGFTAPLRTGVRAGMDLRYVGPQWLRGDEANATAPLPGYTVAALHVTLDRRAWELVGSVRNLFDHHYATFGTFNVNEAGRGRVERFLTPGEPRAVRIELRWRVRP